MRFGYVLLCLASTLAYGQTIESPPAVVLFTIKGSPVYTDEFEYLYRKNHLQTQDYTAAKIDEYLDLFVNFKLKIAEARKRGLDTTRAFIKEFNGYKEELRKPYLADEDDLDRLTRQAYDRLMEEIKAAHILINVKPDASPQDTLSAFQQITELRQQAIAGKDFEALARSHSEDPSAKVNGGNLGYFTAMQMVYPFENAAYATKVGEISSVVRSRFGFHIIKVYDRRPSRGEVEVSHILLRAEKGKEGKVKNTIFEIYDQLKGGRPWDDLCNEYSEDPNTKNGGGRLRPFGVGALASVPEFERVAFSLKVPGEISDPFQSDVGWHIIRLEKRIPLPSYKETETALKRRVARDERLTISKSITFENRKKKLGFKEDSDVRAKSIAQADSSLVKGKWHFRGGNLQDQTLIMIGNEKIAARVFFQWVVANQTFSSFAPMVYMKQLYDRFVEEKVNDVEEKKIMAEHPEYRNLLNEYKEGILLFGIMEKEVWNKASEDSTGQKKYFKDHEDQFKAGSRLEARIFATNDPSVQKSIKKRIETGDTLRDEDVKKFKSVTNWKKYESKESQVIDQVNWVPGIAEVELNKNYYVVEIKRLVPPGYLTFQEARAKVISAYQDSLEKEWLAQLKRKYPVVVNKKGKNLVIVSLKK